MNSEQLLQDSFLKLDQFQKRDILKKFILNDKDCRVGFNIICFDLESYCNKNNKSYYYHHHYNWKTNWKTVKTLTIGKSYKIVDFKPSRVKIINDQGKMNWYTTDRFIYSIKSQRKIKIENIINNYLI